MDLSFVKNDLSKNGYCIVRNVLNNEETKYCVELFENWLKNIHNHDDYYDSFTENGIYKYHQAGHSNHAWFVRTHPNVQKVFKFLWDTDDLIVSFDGCCYIPKTCEKKTRHWTHTDQAPNSKGFKCIQSFISFTENQERTLVVYEGSHLLHEEYFKERKIESDVNWQIIDYKYTKLLENKKRVLHVKPGDLVLWDSRTFHQSQYGEPNSELRMIQYVCFFPKNHIDNTIEEQEKRKRYLETRRTTTHWPAPIHVIKLQPMKSDVSINYNNIVKTDLSLFQKDIQKII